MQVARRLSKQGITKGKRKEKPFRQNLGIYWDIGRCSGIFRDNQAYSGIIQTYSGINGIRTHNKIVRKRTLPATHNPGFRTQNSESSYSEPEAYSEPCRISRIECFVKIVNGYNYLDKLFAQYQLFTFSTL